MEELDTRENKALVALSDGRSAWRDGRGRWRDAETGRYISVNGYEQGTASLGGVVAVMPQAGVTAPGGLSPEGFCQAIEAGMILAHQEAGGQGETIEDAVAGYAAVLARIILYGEKDADKIKAFEVLMKLLAAKPEEDYHAGLEMAFQELNAVEAKALYARVLAYKETTGEGWHGE
jgi:hypothetical protein